MTRSKTTGAKKSKETAGWPTSREKQFIDQLGSSTGPKQTLSRKGLLVRYLRYCQKRVNWGAIDRDQIIEYASDALKRELADESCNDEDRQHRRRRFYCNAWRFNRMAAALA